MSLLYIIAKSSDTNVKKKTHEKIGFDTFCRTCQKLRKCKQFPISCLWLMPTQWLKQECYNFFYKCFLIENDR